MEKDKCVVFKKLIFANGGDRFKDNVPEKKICERLGVEMVLNVGGGKVRSRSKIIKDILERDGV